MQGISGEVCRLLSSSPRKVFTQITGENLAVVDGEGRSQVVNGTIGRLLDVAHYCLARGRTIKTPANVRRN